MRRMVKLTFVAGLLAALLAVPGTAFGQAEFTPYTGTETRDGPFTLLSAHGTEVVQMHFTSEWYDTTSDIRTTGKTIVTGHLTLTDPATGTGIMHGTSVTYVTGQGYEGTWEGTWQGKLIYGVGYFKAVAHGTGDLEGLKMKATFTGVDPDNVNIEGRILDPHGS